MPDPLGQLVAAVGGTAAEAGHRLEEQAAAGCPQPVGLARIDHLGVRHMRQQHLPRGLGHAQRLQARGIAKQRQVALVGVQRMGLRAGCQHHALLQPGLAQRGAGRLVEVEVGQPVVDQVNAQVVVPELAVAPGKRRRIGDHRTQAVALEQLLEQQELGVEKLLLGRLVDDGDAGQRPAAARPPPFLAEHVDDALLEGRHAGFGGQHRIHRGAAGTLRPRQHRVEHGAAGVGVDLDQAEMAVSQVKVVAEKHPTWAVGRTRTIDLARAHPRDGRRGRQHLRPERRQGHHGFNRLHHPGHALHLRRRDKHRLGREQGGATFTHHRREPRLAQRHVERLRQRGGVEAEAEAFAVQGVQRGHGHSSSRGCGGGCPASGQRLRPSPAGAGCHRAVTGYRLQFDIIRIIIISSSPVVFMRVGINGMPTAWRR